MTCGHYSFPHYREDQHSDHGFSASAKQLIILRLYHTRVCLIPFLVPMILSLHMSLGFYSEPVGLRVPATFISFVPYGISEDSFLLYHANFLILWKETFLFLLVIDPYIRRFVSIHLKIHSNHRHFIDSRPIGYTIHLWTGFEAMPYGISQPTLPGFIRIRFPFYTHAGSLEETFQDVTPSFHLSNHQLYRLYTGTLFFIFSKTCRGTSRTYPPHEFSG